jgi:phthalate 4,5-dioxygenase oxygenase subunit
LLSELDNRTLTQTGPGTPMGNLFRRFWWPALLPSELPAPDSAPIRFRILSEDLIAFRDTDGEIGFLAQACPHRGASLFFGRNEEAGLRCVYHGWKFDVTGACVDMPSEPAESNFKSKVNATAYPAAEYGGVVWIYMGPRDKQPPLPQYDWCIRPATPNLVVYKWMQDSNYAQGVEGDIDTVHGQFLHRTFGAARSRGVDPNVAPSLQLTETEFGFAYGGRRVAPDGRFYWRITPFVVPTLTSIPDPNWDGDAIFRVPLDDEHTWWFRISPRGRKTAAGAPEREHVVLIPGTWRQTHNQGNDYLIDREAQRSHNFTGLPGNRVQDAMATESMGAICDRTQEHLGTTDLAIIAMRRQLLRMARDLEQGIEAPILNGPSLFRVRPVDILTTEPNLPPIWEADHSAHLSEEPRAILDSRPDDRRLKPTPMVQ